MASVTTCELRPNGGVVINETNFVERGGRVGRFQREYTGSAPY
jgi:hypothetical protein